MTIQLYNTLSREKAPFTPLDPGNVRLYVCGPTVYDVAHIGNARPVVVFDVLFRLLRHVYGPGHVTYARNITDLDDKIIAAAKETGEPIDRLTARTTRAFHEDMAALGALEPSIEPRATGHIDRMIAMIQQLIDRGHAYQAEGHVLFSVPSAPDYGKLSRRDRDEMIAGARVEVAPYKRDPADFVLWKPSDPDQPGWASPWGRGRPGWHIECSAMAAVHLGETFDIHGGGADLIFPHHENEIAQSVCAHGKEFVRLWMHNGYVVVEGEKMSKSLGNFFTVRQLLEEDDWGAENYKKGEAIRFTLLTAHYRQPLDFTRDKLKDSKAQLDRFYIALAKLRRIESEARPTPPASVVEALCDDLNTPLAISRLHEILDSLNKKMEKGGRAAESEPDKSRLLGGGALLGLLDKDPEAWLKGGAEDRADAAEIERLIAKRDAARKARNFAEADRIRAELAARGIALEDGAKGTTWRRA
ncbi:MAG: cysteine--tRNA ligase [Kiloniellaceae bacterium]